MSPSKKALHFGAGNIGRGFIGALLSNAGYKVTFADVQADLINALNAQGHYKIHTLDLENNGAVETISNVAGIFSTDEAAMKEAIVNADIITTAVGPNVLRIIARTIAKGLSARREAGKGEINIIACENLTGASSHLREEVLKSLKSDADKKYISEKVGFPNCSVDRIVPPFEGNNNKNSKEEITILSVGVENFYEWIVEEPALKGEKPDIPGMKFTDNLVAYVQRKLFTLNCGHAITAYLGFLKGYATVDESLHDAWIDGVVRAAMEESGAALCKKHGFDRGEHSKYISRIEKRFRNPYIRDDVVRVGREPLRKLGQADRLVGPVKMAKEFGLNHDHLLQGIAAALHYNNPDDQQSKELHERILREGLGKVVAEVTGFVGGSEEQQEIVVAFNDLSHLRRHHDFEGKL